MTNKKPIKKFRKKRQLTEDQKQVLRDRINKAREKLKPAANLTVHESIRDLPDDHKLSPRKVRQWIKHTKEKLSGMRGWRTSNDAKQKTEYHYVEGYLHNMQAYLRDGTWRDLYYGEDRNYLIKYKCIAMAYHPDGTPKRSVGVWYPDIGTYYTQEMYYDDNPTIKPYRKRKSLLNKSKVHKTRRKYRKRA